MNFRKKRRWRIIKNYSLGWVLALVFYSIIRGEGTRELGSVQIEVWRSILISFIIGPIIGVISGYAQILTEEKIDQRISILKLITLRFIFALLFLTTIIVVAYFLVVPLMGVNIGLIEFAFEPGSFAIYLYILTVDIFLAILRQVNLLLGEKNLWKLVRGQFYIPREEERIFMFLDLQASTQLAEKLGHIKYSMLIQDCFNHLGIVEESEAEIYQYVGDEVILTWKLEDGLRNQNCLKAYFNFKQELSDTEEYYLNKYDCKPFFKAGMNAGVVTITEVGKYKKEIAYHGDTINTAARIQAKCNDFNQALLISDHVKDKLDQSGFEFTPLGDIPLKGKESEVVIYAVTEILSK